MLFSFVHNVYSVHIILSFLCISATVFSVNKNVYNFTLDVEVITFSEERRSRFTSVCSHDKEKKVVTVFDFEAIFIKRRHSLKNKSIILDFDVG